MNVNEVEQVEVEEVAQQESPQMNDGDFFRACLVMAGYDKTQNVITNKGVSFVDIGKSLGLDPKKAWAKYTNLRQDLKKSVDLAKQKDPESKMAKVKVPPSIRCGVGKDGNPTGNRRERKAESLVSAMNLIDIQ